MVLRERNGKTLPFVFASEDEAVPTIVAWVEQGSTVYGDESRAWDSLHARFTTKRINHSLLYSDGIAWTNWAESYFSRLRRAEIGVHHRISGKYLDAYAEEMAWREDYRRVANGTQYLLIAGAALAYGVSRRWKGYWQKHEHKVALANG